MAPSQKDGAGPEDKPPPPDWAEIYADLLCHTSISVTDIPKMTIPQIDAIRARLGKNIAIKIGMPNIFGGISESNVSDEGTSSQEDVDSFFNDF